MKKIFISFTFIVTVFFTVSLKANTSDETNNLLKHLDYLYKNFPLGIAQKDFKNLIPDNWSTTDRMLSHKQNVNPAGDINNGYFFYELKTNDLYYPLLQFQFWEKKLVNIDITILAHDMEDNNINNIILDNQTENFNSIYGQPIKKENKGTNKLYDWEKNSTIVNLRFNPKDENNKQQVGALDINIKDTNNYSAMNDFASRRPKIKYYDEYFVSVTCEQKLQSGNVLQFGFFYDTRLLSKELSNQLKDSIEESISNDRINCLSELTQVSEFDKKWLDITLPNKKSVMDTYLYFKTADNITAWAQFFAGEYTDALCEKYQKEMIASGLEAECIYGHDIN